MGVVLTTLHTCSTCGLGQTVPEIPAGMRACCARCGTSLISPLRRWRSSSRAAAIALAALILYPLAVSLPMLRIEQFGHASDSSILSGIARLFGSGNVAVGIIVLLCSVVFPLFKLMSLLALSLGSIRLAHRHRAFTWRIIEWTGRWGMLDVLLVAILVAALKLGDTFEVTPGPGALAFAMVVVLSLVATACFDPHAMWGQQR
jgi:paraquat-inducible protein A